MQGRGEVGQRAGVARGQMLSFLGLVTSLKWEHRSKQDFRVPLLAPEERSL